MQIELISKITNKQKDYTVVKWGHTEGIGREKTSSQNSQGIALDFWTLFSLSNLRAEYNWRAIDALIFWYKYLQKVNAMPSDFWWKKQTSFAPLMNIFLIRFLKDQKLFVKEAKLFFFIRNLRALHLVFAGN